MVIERIKNYRQIKVKYLSATNYRGSRVCIYEPKRYNNDKTQRVYLPYNYEIGCIQQQAKVYLEEKGFNIVGRASELENYIFFCNNWGANFIELNSLSSTKSIRKSKMF